MLFALQNAPVEGLEIEDLRLRPLAGDARPLAGDTGTARDVRPPAGGTGTGGGRGAAGDGAASRKAGRWPERLDGRPGGAPWTTFGGARAAAPLEVPWTERGLIICGDGAEDTDPLREMAEAAGWPILA